MAKIGLIAAGLLVATTAAAAAHGVRYDIDKRQYLHAKSIHEGRRDGGLTWYETWRLRKEQRRIGALEARARADGHLTRSERTRIADAQDEARRHIYHQRHDGQVRGFWWRLTQ
jgi:hypothetical protein